MSTRSGLEPRVSRTTRRARLRPAPAGPRTRGQIPQGAVAVLLGGLVLLVSLLVVLYPHEVSWAVFMPAVVLSGVVHRPSYHALIITLTFTGIVAAGWAVRDVRSDAPLTLLAVSAVSFVSMWRCLARAEVGSGVHGTRGESLLRDLRDRLESLGRIPELPGPWHVEASIQSAFGDRFSGDFVLAHHDPVAGRADVVLADVSGKGLSAGGRSVLLCSSFNALLSSLPADRFLPSANDYLCRQSWDEGFASAVHLAIDVPTRAYSISSAGHPPALVYTAAAGTWSALPVGGGPVLGVLPDSAYPAHTGVLGPGDAILLYTDGLIENRILDLDAGIGHLVASVASLTLPGSGSAESPAHFTGAARRVCTAGLGGARDDRAVVLVWVAPEGEPDVNGDPPATS